MRYFTNQRIEVENLGNFTLIELIKKEVHYVVG